MSDRDDQGGFLPGGPSANPGGWPALDPSLKVKLQGLTPRAIQRLEEAMNGKDARLAVQAANAVLGRAWGRPAQAVDVRSDQMDFAQAHSDGARRGGEEASRPT
jgi:hypothetical protein